MGEKKIKKNEGGEKKNNGEVVEKKEGEGKKNDGNLTVVLKSDCRVTKVFESIQSVGGVKEVTCYHNSKKLTVIEKVQQITRKYEYIELISPVSKKDGKAKGGDAGAGDEKKKQNKEKDSKENKGGGENKKTIVNSKGQVIGKIEVKSDRPAQPPKKEGGDNKKAKGGDGGGENGKGDKGKVKGKK